MYYNEAIDTNGIGFTVKVLGGNIKGKKLIFKLTEGNYVIK